ncbi:MAG: UbiA family prenyltransferase [Calditrichaeota bacterium]|nr:UbiA family prenyltransferase [Calditrichota bacterium]
MIRTDTAKEPAEVSSTGGSLVKALDVLFVLRPTLMFPLFTIILAGHNTAVGARPLAVHQWLMLVVGLCAMFGVVYLLNQIRDRKSDKENGKLFLVSDKILSKNQLMLEAGLLIALMPVAFYFAGFVNLVFWVLAMFLVAGILYNFTPLALQNQAFGGILSGLIGGWLLIRFGSLIAGTVGNWIVEAPYVIGFASVALLTCLPDQKGDATQGKKTFAVVFGASKTIFAGLLGFIITSTWGFINGDLIIAIPSGVAVPVLIWGWLKKSVPVSTVANKIGIFGLSIAVGLMYPAYLVIIVLYFPFARWYYSRRFGLKYPSFGA